MRHLGSLVLLVGVLLAAGSTQTVAAQLCLPDIRADQPFATTFGKARLHDSTAIISGDVFVHVQRLKKAVAALDISLETESRVTVPLKDVLPRHNYVLAYDLLVLLQLWHQERQQIAHIPPTMNYPRSIQPKDVFAWVDAVLGLVICLVDEDLDLDFDETNIDINITPRDVYFDLDRLMRAISREVSSHMRLAMQTQRLNQILYFLQDVLLSKDNENLVVWDIDQAALDSHGLGDANSPQIAAQILSELDKLNGRQVVIVDDQRLGHDEQARSQALTFLLAQVFGELQNWSHDQGIVQLPPPLAPVVELQGNDLLIVQRLSQIHELLHDTVQRHLTVSTEGHRHD